MKIVLRIIGIILLALFLWFGGHMIVGFAYLNRPWYMLGAVIFTALGAVGLVGAILSINHKNKDD